MGAKKNNSANANMLVAFVVLVVIVLGITVIGFFFMKPEPEVIQGEVEVNELRVSGKVPGRVAKFLVTEGQMVKQGDTLVLLDSPEVEAKLLQAKAAERAASALSEKAANGAREEQIKSAYEMWQKALAGLEVAKKSYDRVLNLFEKEVVPAQKKDEAEANYKAMLATEQAAKLQYELAMKGAAEEDKSAAKAQLSRARGAVAEVRSYLSETVLLSPIDGEVSEIFPQRGELVGSGAPIMNIADVADVWVTFNIREKDYQKFAKGSEFKAFVPALGNKELTLKVSFVKDMGAFAAWKATKVSGEFDSKTFEIRAVPVDAEGLVPGMSVIVKE
ncbi:MAG: efflux RND transporter periplasmic adaptor subunit [Paludibacteraceae bacterium]|jgi:HlyD family secretion protein|nr:efflux RND transporter periplasmic adaptor subunit [Paludibacteraceae bacterium]MEE0997273.1 efflux RND transporter periplasmic adaptor subunit [Paludibacteraceae bacterium]MEE1540842.1 efflux RND transporter periplasmic adaptor subunit [Paludibacteraceae bacterium]